MSTRKAAGRPSSTDDKAVSVTVKQGDITALKTELLVVDAYEGADEFGGVTAAVDEATGGALSRVLTAGDFRGKLRETVLIHPEAGPAKRVLLVGLGKVEALTPDRVRRVSAVVARRARDLGVRSFHTVLHGVGRPRGTRTRRKPVDGGPSLDPEVAGQAVAEGALLGLYRFTRYKGKAKDEDDDAKAKLSRIVIVEQDAAHVKAAKAGVKVGAVVAEGTNLCRDWQALSGDDAAPEQYGERAKELAKESGLRAEVLTKRRIEALGMGGLLAVSSGSAREPRFVVLEHRPARPKGTIVLVGKGVTFDSGGISIKPSGGMEDMKMDKTGAAAVTGAVLAAKRLDLPLRVVAVTPYAENMPSGTAYKPGDIVTTMSGRTIEVINTDAEGRVILADALHYADRFKPDAVVELSTLTGACPIAVGHLVIAGMGNSDDLMAQLRRAGDETNERVWPLPFLDEYGEMVKSTVADVKNSAGRLGASITAGKFLEHFIGDWPWVHLDIAGTAWHAGSKPRFNDEYSPEHATGVGVRLLVEWMRAFEKPAKTPKPHEAVAEADKDRQAGAKPATPTQKRVSAS